MDRTLTAAVLANLVLSGAHGAVHAVAGVPVAPWHGAVLGVGLVLAPVAGLVMVRRGRGSLAVALVGAGAALALAMEAPWHFLLATPDHVAHADAGVAFAATALLTTAGDALVVLAAAGAWRPTDGG
jgi:hypothetical protein